MGTNRTPEEVVARKAKKDSKRLLKVKLATPQITEQQFEDAFSAALKMLSQGVRLSEQLNPSRPSFNQALKDSWKAIPKVSRKRLLAEDRKAGAVNLQRSTEAQSDLIPAGLPFVTESGDHCETSPQAYKDIVPLLKLVAESLGKSQASKLRLWDPYYCAGAVKRHLAALGFPKVYNECEDFYDVAERQLREAPKHDVIVTNPPYSDTKDGSHPHARRLLRYARKSGKPFLLNMPEYCTTASYYQEEFPDPKDAPLLLCPYRRYHFWTPTNARPGRNPKTHHRKDLGFRNSPFVALWYVRLDPIISRKELLKLARTGTLQGIDIAGGNQHERSEEKRCRLCKSCDQLPSGRGSFKAVAAKLASTESPRVKTPVKN